MTHDPAETPAETPAQPTDTGLPADTTPPPTTDTPRGHIDHDGWGSGYME